MNIYVHTPGREFLWPYIKKAASAHTLTDNAGEADVAIMVSSTDIYTAGELLLAAESTPTNPDSAWIGHESAFAAGCENCRTVILRCPNVIGTAMTGFPRELAESIFRGTFFHFKGNEARVGAVHAADVAAAIAALAEMPTAEGIYNISDGENPTLHDLAEAIAFRMNNKRISTLSTKGQLWLGRLIYGKKRYSTYTTSRTFDCSRLCRTIDYRPTPTTEYLRTHVYDENSL